MTSHKAIVSGISGRYAVALFELADAANALKDIETDIVTLKAMIEDSADLRDLVVSPLYSRQNQQKGITKVAETGSFNDLTQKFLGTLAANRRLDQLLPIIASFEKLLAYHRGEVSAEVTSAQALSDAQLADLKEKLKSAIGRDVAIEADVDETLLGGLKVKVGSQMLDSSLKTKLDNLAIAMKGVQ